MQLNTSKEPFKAQIGIQIIHVVQLPFAVFVTSLQLQIKGQHVNQLIGQTVFDIRQSTAVITGVVGLGKQGHAGT